MTIFTPQVQLLTLHELLLPSMAKSAASQPQYAGGVHACTYTCTCTLFFVTAYWWAKSGAALPLLSGGGGAGAGEEGAGAEGALHLSAVLSGALAAPDNSKLRGLLSLINIVKPCSTAFDRESCSTKRHRLCGKLL